MWITFSLFGTQDLTYCFLQSTRRYSPPRVCIMKNGSDDLRTGTNRRGDHHTWQTR